MYHIIIRILSCPMLGYTCAKLWISYEKHDGRRHRTIDAITKGRRLL